MHILTASLINFVRAEIEKAPLAEINRRTFEIDKALRVIIREELVASNLLVQRDPFD